MFYPSACILFYYPLKKSNVFFSFQQPNQNQRDDYPTAIITKSPSKSKRPSSNIPEAPPTTPRKLAQASASSKIVLQSPKTTMTVSVTHSQQLAITTSTSNPIMPLTMVQQSSSSATMSTSPPQSSSSAFISSSSGCSDATTPAKDPKTQQQHQFVATQSHSSSRTNQHFSNNNNNNCNNNTICTSNTSSSSSTSTSASTTALRRLYFKSGRSAKTRQTPSVPKVRGFRI